MPGILSWGKEKRFGLQGKVSGAPVSADAGGSDGAFGEGVAFVAVIHNLLVVDHFAYVGSVVVQPHVADEQDLAVLHHAGKRAINCKQTKTTVLFRGGWWSNSLPRRGK